MNYYNDNDPTKAAWLRQLIEDRLIPYGEVDERSICDVQPSDLVGYAQWHFFAGIGGWSKALALARWPEFRRVATASCPCQPFSQTGKKLGHADPRHLWPEFYRLVKQAGFPAIFGEQVASPDGLVWLDGVSADLEAAGYTFGAHDLCAAGVSAPQLRQRLYWVAYANEARCERGERSESAFVSGSQQQIVRLADADDERWQGRDEHGNGSHQRTPWSAGVGVCGRDGKTRRIEPGILPLAARLPIDVALIGGAGDAIVPHLAAEFIQASEEARYV